MKVTRESGFLHLQLSGVDEALANYKDTPRRVQSAVRQALRATGRIVEKSVEGDIINDTKARAALIRKHRVKLSRRLIKRDVALIWTGSRPIKPKQLGKLTQNRTGAKAGRVEFPGGFIATMPNGKVSIWKRKYQKRLPIIEQKLFIDAAAEAAAERRAAEAPSIFRNELNRILAKRMAQKSGGTNGEA